MTRTRGSVFWVRWSLRDLRRRWQLVLAIALLIAMGTGLATGLGSMESWRVRSADASYAALHAHDLRVTLSEGSYVPTGTLGRAVRGSAVARLVDRAEERLVVGTQVDASSEGRVVLTAARMIGVPLDDADSPVVDALSIDRGHGLVEGSDGVVVESKYADYHGLRAAGVVRVAGARRLEVVGHGTSPDTFLVIPPAGLFGGEASFAVVWAPLALAQEAGGVGDRVNELVLTVVPSADVATVERGLRDALRGIPGDVGATLTRQEDEDVHRILYEDAANDQQFMTVFAVLVLAGAAFGTFNLVTRIVEAQRREIGIGIALGVSSGRLAIRPLLLAAEVALLGVLLGVTIGLGMGRVLGGVLADLLPLPVTKTPFEPGVFARGALLGFLVPFVAALYPVIRGVGMRLSRRSRSGCVARARAHCSLSSAVCRFPSGVSPACPSGTSCARPAARSSPRSRSRR